MKTYEFRVEQLLNMPLTEAWDFFSSPRNLSKITPPELDFKIISAISNNSIFNGMEITYTVKPVLGIPVKWKTRINNVVNNQQFTDTQLEGPYSLWEHTHIFAETERGVLMTDIVKYRLPLGFLGQLAHKLFVHKKIQDIFTYRRLTLKNLFNKNGALAH